MKINKYLAFILVLVVTILASNYLFNSEKKYLRVQISAMDESFSERYDGKKSVDYTSFRMQTSIVNELPVESSLSEDNLYKVVFLDHNGKVYEEKQINIPVKGQAINDCSCPPNTPCKCPWEVTGETTLFIKYSSDLKKIQLLKANQIVEEVSL